MMKSTGVVRAIDMLGRLVMPAELRRQLHLSEGNQIEFLVDGDRVILQKYLSGCIFCGNTTDIIHFKDKPVCAACQKLLADDLAKLQGKG